MSKDWNFNATGPQLREICEMIHYVWFYAGWIEHDKIEDEIKHINIDDIRQGNFNNVTFDWSILLPTLKLSLKYVIHKSMRRAYSCMFKKSIEYNESGEMPHTISQMHKYYRHAWNLICKFDNEMVCVTMHFVGYK